MPHKQPLNRGRTASFSSFGLILIPAAFLAACSGPTVTLSGTLSCHDTPCERVVMGVIGPGDEVFEIVLNGPGPFAVPVRANLGEAMLYAFDDVDGDNQPGESEPWVDQPLTVQGDDIGNLTVTLGVETCSEAPLDGELALRSIPWSVDTDFDPQITGGDCGPVSVWIRQNEEGYILAIEADLDPASELMLEFRQPGSQGWGAEEFELVAFHDSGTWLGAITMGSEIVGEFEVTETDSGLETQVGFHELGRLEGYRIRASHAGQASGWVQLGAFDGLADASGVPMQVDALYVAMRTGYGEEELTAIVNDVGGELVMWDEVVNGGVVSTEASTIAQAESLQSALLAQEAVDTVALAQPTTSFGVQANDLQAWSGSDSLAAWAYTWPQIMEAQTLTAECSWRTDRPEPQVTVAVVDSDLAESDAIHSAYTDYLDAAAAHEVKWLSMPRNWLRPYSSVRKPSHGLAVAGIVDRKSDTHANPTPFFEYWESWKDPFYDYYEGDRLSGVLNFCTDDGTWCFAPRLQLVNYGYTGGEEYWSPWALKLAANSDPRPAVINVSFGVVLDGIHCDASDCEWSWGEYPLCSCTDGPHYNAKRCGYRDGVPNSGFDRYNKAIGDVVDANPDILFVFAAGNNCANLDEENATAAALAHKPNVIVVGGQRIWGGDVHLERYKLSNYGDRVHMWAPGAGVLRWKPLLTREVDIDEQTNTLFGEDDFVWGHGTSFSAPLVTSTAALVKAIDPTLSPTQVRDRLIAAQSPAPTGAGGGTLSTLNAVSMSLRDVIQPGTNMILSVHSSEYTTSCDVGPSETELAPVFGMSCAMAQFTAGGDVHGTGQANADDGESWHLITGASRGGGLSIVLEGTDFSPGPGPSKTTLDGSLTYPDPDQTTGEKFVWFNGTLVGGVTLEDGDGNVTDHCNWSGEFTGTVVFVPEDGS